VREFDEAHDLFGRELEELQARNPSPHPPKSDSGDHIQHAMSTADHDEVQEETTKEEFERKMHDHAVKTASSLASDKIQRSYQLD
jgi:hypothetical protein